MGDENLVISYGILIGIDNQKLEKKENHPFLLNPDLGVM